MVTKLTIGCLWLTALGMFSPSLAQLLPPPSNTGSAFSPKFSFGVLADAYYSYNFTNAAIGPGGSNIGYFNPIVEGYTLAFAEFSMTARQGEGSAHLSAIYGESADAIANLGAFTLGGPLSTGYFYIWEAYGSYHPGDWTFNFGKFATHLGFEVLESNQDWTYTRSLLFTNPLMPRYHYGMSANFTAPDKTWGITGYVYDGVNQGNLGAGQGYLYGLKATASPEKSLDLVFNGLTGPIGGGNNSFFADYFAEFITRWRATTDLSFALDALLNNQFLDMPGLYAPCYTYWGTALYGRYQFAPDWAIATRLEETEKSTPAWNEISVFGGFDPIPASSSEVRELTLTLEHALTAHVLLRLEGRYDYALGNGQTYAPGAGPYAGGSDDQYTGTMGVVVGF